MVPETLNKENPAPTMQGQRVSVSQRLSENQKIIDQRKQEQQGKSQRYIAISDVVDTSRQESADFTPFRNIINELYAKDTSKKVRSANKPGRAYLLIETCF